MNVTEAIQNRRSVRKYKPGHVVPKEHIDQLLEAAMSAPSAHNSRPWEFVVIQSEAVRNQIPTFHPYCKFLPDASLAIVVCGLPQAWPDAPGVGYWAQDCAAVTQNVLLQATELGYGSCWCGLYPNPEPTEQMAKLLDVQSVPLSLIVIGIADIEPKKRGFVDPEKVKYIR